MRRYALGLVLFSVFILVFGFITGKISSESFQYISIPGLFFAVVKSLVVVLVLLLALMASIPSFLIDFILLFVTDYDFPILSNLWNVCWDGVTLNWFWTETTGSSLFFGALILLLISGAFSRRRW
ncbi:hypothetical protein [Flavilitoribacter nigricans]|uniref:Uncharacterized protein n=1 Tax=Flavilitoribacter nigricans (strain ATCC 23147 / DSM 23189 / NBRC 102662 / NCIMB 1420 / SS-2) TaxID=1122177 RepID=A0A2D0MZ62_FLAN2|nr:hypothetical protein [Flavilitoribacter nigricans]PHN01572.1 hypothetical protein CRP01_36335 [Flavilitoribacter nigricans DSM 23189 = NBRC 102662]